jgi:hypothetical protein
MKTINLKSLLIGALLISTIFLGVAAALPGVGAPGIAPGGVPGLPGGALGGGPALIDPNTGLPILGAGGPVPGGLPGGVPGVLPGVGPGGGGFGGGLPIGGIGLPGGIPGIGPAIDPRTGLPLSEYTVKLEFKLKGEEEDTFFVLSSGGDYTIDQSHSGPESEQSLGINGNVASITDVKKVRLTYSVTEKHADINEGNKGQFTLKGSAILKASKETVLGRLGGRILAVTATVDE